MEIPIGYNLVYGPENLESAGLIDSAKHQLIVGKSGTGKSTLLEQQAILQAQAGHGFLFIDPHGGSADVIAANLPLAKLEKTLYFTPLGEKIIGLNPFPGANPDLEVDAFKTLVKTLWPQGWGPETENILTNACYALYEVKAKFTPDDLKRFLLDVKFRDEIFNELRNEDLRLYFSLFENRDGSGWDKRMRTEKTAPPLNKLNKLTDPILQPILCQLESFDFRRAIDEGWCLIFNLSKGSIGADRAAFLGSIVLHKISLAFLSRYNSKKRSPFYVYVDEFNSFIGCTDISVMLAESRKYGGRFCLATQTVEPIPEETRQVVFGNCSTLVSFRVGAADAKRMAAEYGDEFPATALLNCSDYHFYLKTVLGGTIKEPQMYHGYPPLDFNYSQLQKVIRTSNARYGKPRPPSVQGSEGKSS